MGLHLCNWPQISSCTSCDRLVRYSTNPRIIWNLTRNMTSYHRELENDGSDGRSEARHSSKLPDNLAMDSIAHFSSDTNSVSEKLGGYQPAINEKLPLDIAGARILHRACQPQPLMFPYELSLALRRLDLELEAPLLCSEHAVDVRTFGQAVCKVHKDISLSLGSSNSKDVYLCLLASRSSMVNREAKLCDERLDVPREALSFLRQVMLAQKPRSAFESTCSARPQQQSLHKQLQQLWPTTGPMILSQHSKSPELPLCVYSLLLEGDPTGLKIQDSQEAGNIMDGNHALLLHDHQASQDLETHSSYPLVEKEIASVDLADEPAIASQFCLPFEASQLDMSGSLSRNSDIPYALPSFQTSFPNRVDLGACETTRGREGLINSDAVAMQRMTNFVEAIKGESLTVASTNIRFPEIKYDHDKASHPWKSTADQIDVTCSSASKYMVNPGKSDFLHLWSGSNEIEQELSWRPFPSQQAKINLAEDIGFSEYQATTSTRKIALGSADFGSCSRKRQGPQVLYEQNETEEDLSLAQPLLRRKWTPLAKKRKAGIENKTLPTSSKKAAVGLNRSLEGQTFGSHMSLDLCSASSRLEGFLTFQKKEENASKRNELNHDSAAVKGKAGNIPESRPTRLQTQTLKTPWAVGNIALNHSMESESLSDISLSQEYPIVVSSSVLDDKFTRSLIRSLANSLGPVEMVERNCKRTTIPKTIGTAQEIFEDRSTRDADIAISASVGLILTSIQKVKQQSILPKSSFESQMTTLFMFRGHIIRALRGYNDLTILIVPSTGMEWSPLDSRDAAALGDLAGFCVGILSASNDLQHPNEALNDLGIGRGEHASGTRYSDNDDVIAMRGSPSQCQTILCSGHTSATVRHLGTRIVEHTLSSSMVTLPKLLHEETLWEMFLRRAGLNTYAAQVMLANLDDKTEHSGLVALMCMSRDDRLAQFGTLVTGGRVLSAMGDLLESKWISIV